MAISLFFVPLLSLNKVSSSSSTSSFAFSLCSLKPQSYGVAVRNQWRSVVSYSASEIDSGSDYTNGRHTQLRSLTPIGVTMNEAGLPTPAYKWRRVFLKESGEALDIKRSFSNGHDCHYFMPGKQDSW